MVVPPYEGWLYTSFAFAFAFAFAFKYLNTSLQVFYLPLFYYQPLFGKVRKTSNLFDLYRIESNQQ